MVTVKSMRRTGENLSLKPRRLVKVFGGLGFDAKESKADEMA